MGFLDIIDPAIDSVKRLLKMDQNSYSMSQDSLRKMAGIDRSNIDEESVPSSSIGNYVESESGFDIDAFIMDRLSLDPSKLEVQMETTAASLPRRYRRKAFKATS